MQESDEGRRQFLRAVAGAGLGLMASPVFARIPAAAERELTFYNTHTGESLNCTYWADGQYLTEGLTELNRILRDHRSGEIYPIASELIDLVYALDQKVGGTRPFEIISGYRSPKTNTKLRNKNSGVAKRSLHMSGKAIDIRLPCCELKDLHRAALALKTGGVGYYPGSNFIHVDIGRVRSW